jgi:site-specific recombinase XerD
VTIGVHGRVTPDQARLEARRLLGLVSTGVDPAEQKQQEKGQPTFEDLLELFFSQHVNSKLKNNTAASYERLCRLHLPSSIRKMRIVDVGRKHVTRLHHDMRTKPYAANAVLAVMSKFFNWCEKHGYALDDSSTSIAMCQVCDVI